MASGTIKKANADIDVLTITATTGTGGGAGVLTLSKATYPYKALIPNGISTNFAYSVENYTDNANSWLLGVRNVTTNAWVAGTSVTFKAIGIK